MSLLAAVLLAVTSARVESVYLTTLDQKLAVRVALSGTPGIVAIHREGAAARVSITDASLGMRFAGGRRFAWTPSDGFDPALLAASPAKLDRLEIAATDAEVSVLLHVPAEVAVDVRRDTRGLLLVFRTGPAAEPAAPRVAAAAAFASPATAAPRPAPPSASPTPAPPPPTPAPTPRTEPAPVAAAPAPASAPPMAAPVESRPEPAVAAAAPPPAPVAAAPPPATASADTTELAKRLFPAPAAEGQSQPGSGAVADLYPQLFPTGAPQGQPEAPVVTDVPEPGEDQGAVLGPFRVRVSVDARYVDADTFVELSAEPTRDDYLEVQPRVFAAAPVGSGSFTLEYAPVLRAFATYDQVNSSSHLVGAGLELPVGTNVVLKVRDRFQSGVLDTRVVDPGGEYFFGLGRFNRNDLEAGASISVGPRLSVELGGSMGMVHFVEESSFFDYDTRLASAGLGFELTPRLRAIASYVYDTVPTPDERPEAESTAHSARLSLSGEILPLLNGDLSVGYRSQDSPNAGLGGTSYSGFTMSAALQRELGQDATFSVYANRSTPLSAYQENAFYVSTGVQGVLEVPLVARFEARGGIGYQWNDYRTVDPDILAEREDRILGWFVGLRRPIAEKLSLSAAYRKEERSSNNDRFDTDAEGIYLQLEWDIFGSPRR